MPAAKEQTRQMEQLYRQTYPSLLIYAQSALRNDHLAEEAVQDTFRIACGKQNAVFQSGNPAGWLMNTLKYVIQNMKRSRARLNRLVVQAMTLSEDLAVSQPQDHDLEADLQRVLSPQDYQMLVLTALHGYTMKDLAVEFDLSVEACKKRLQRAKKKLQEQWEESAR